MAVVLVAASGCVQQRVEESVTEHARVEGNRYAQEVKAQSPFQTVEMRWSEADKLMEKRNPSFVAARSKYQEAKKKKPVVREMTEEIKGAVDLSIGDVFKPDALLESIRTPATQLPKQLASLGKIKNLSHEIEGNVWEDTVTSVDAEIEMRQERVKLHQMLRMGELIDRELSRVNSTSPPEGSDPKLVSAFDAWRGQLRNEREKWLGEIRNFFDAEYHDVHFVKDKSSFPTYDNVRQPDLTEWQRWCHLNRSKELVALLRKGHDSSAPAIPGTRIVQEKINDLVRSDKQAPAATLQTSSIRNEVRSLIQHWREMKDAQAQAEGLENQDSTPCFEDLDRINRRQQIFKLRQQEIQHASAVWLMDEDCWSAGAVCRR